MACLAHTTTLSSLRYGESRTCTQPLRLHSQVFDWGQVILDIDRYPLLAWHGMRPVACLSLRCVHTEISYDLHDIVRGTQHFIATIAVSELLGGIDAVSELL